MFTSSQPTQFTVIMARESRMNGERVITEKVEVGYYGTSENAEKAAQDLLDAMFTIAPESLRRGEIRVFVIEPTVSYRKVIDDLDEMEYPGKFRSGAVMI